MDLLRKVTVQSHNCQNGVKEESATEKGRQGKLQLVKDFMSALLRISISQEEEFSFFHDHGNDIKQGMHLPSTAARVVCGLPLTPCLPTHV